MRIEQPLQPLNTEPSRAGNVAARKVLGATINERTAGFMPTWTKETGAQNTIEQNIQSTLNAKPAAPSDNRLAYASSSGAADSAEVTKTTEADEAFGFGDLFDIINPLQHLPVVGHLYREFTGDTIRPIGQIIGGGLFAGPLGVASGLINAVVEEETGKDVTGNAFAMMFQNEAPQLKSNKLEVSELERTQNARPQASGTPYSTDDIGQLLALSDLKSDETIEIVRLKG